MKDYLIILKVTLIGLFVAAFAYPVVHEAGHILATVITGGKFVSLAWAPVPNVLCEMNTENTAALAITSLAGIVFPMFMVLPFIKAKGNLRFSVLIFNAIIIWSTIIGLAVAVMQMNDCIIPNDDLTAFMEYTGWIIPTIFIMLSLTGIAFFLLYLLKPKETIMSVMGMRLPK